MPVFNRPVLPGQAIASVQRQNDVAFELLVVDDGSTDDSAQVIRALAERDGRIRLLHCSRSGPAAARNLGIAQVRGEYVTFLDSDDLSPPGRLRRQVDKLDQWSDVMAVVGTILGFEEVGSDDEPQPHTGYSPYYNLALHSGTFRTSCLRELGPLDESLTFGEDVDFFLRLFEKDAPILLEAEIGSYYRHHAGNMVHHTTARQHGYAAAYARSLQRRRASGRTRPLQSFFNHPIGGDIVFGGGS
jgi:glycosyltransferase involved in cell wall biosynthesis